MPKPHRAPIDLANGALWLLGDSVPIDARISWRAAETFGQCEPMNVYLVVGGHEAILVEAGVAALRDTIAGQVIDVLGDKPDIARIAVTRNEPDAISNLPNLARLCGLKTAFTPGVINPFDFFDDASAKFQMKSFGVEQHPARPGMRITIGADRWLIPVQTPLRLLSTIWYYDTGTKTLFCSDIFSGGTHVQGASPLSADALDAGAMKRHLLQKYDWLAYSNLTEIIHGLTALFAEYEIEILAPSRGCPTVGRAVIQAKIDTLLQVLSDVGRNKPRQPVKAAPKQDQSVVTENRMVYSGFNTRDLGGGVHLLGGCFHASMYGRQFHSHASAYLIEGTTASMIVDTGHAKDGAQIADFIRNRVGNDLTYIFPTHEEYPHAGNLGGLMAAFPGAKVVGDIRNYHLYFPDEFAAGRFTALAVGDAVDLGERQVNMLPAIIHDLPNSLWAYDDQARMMFVSDAFGFSHYEERECTLFSEELPSLPSIADTKQVLDLALYWTRFAEKDEIIDGMRGLFKKYPTAMVAPAHGNVVTRPDELAGLMDEALLATTL